MERLVRRRRWGLLKTVRRVLWNVWRDPAVAGRRPQAIFRVISWNISKRVQHKIINRELVPGVTIRCYPDSSISSKVVYLGGFTDHYERAFLESYLRDGDQVLDCGANIGTYTLLCAHLVGPAGRVHAFEPHPTLHRRLCENISLNGFTERVVTHHLALSNQTGLLPFESDRDTANRLAPVGSDHEHDGTIWVPTTRLDEMPINGRIHFAKADVEGAEDELIEGALGLLATNPPDVWLIEVVTNLLLARGRSPHQLFERLRGSGYRFAKHDRRLGLIECNPEGSHDILAVLSNRWETVRERVMATR